MTLEISEREDINGVRKKVSMVRRGGGGGRNTLARKKVIRCSASRGQAEEDGALACGERKSRFEKMKFVPWRIPVSIFTMCMCLHVCTRARVFHISAFGWIIFIAHFPARVIF